MANKCIPQLEKIGLGFVRESSRGVPHLVFNQMSVTWFAKTEMYRVFWPWPSQFQKKKDFEKSEDVRAFLLRETFPPLKGNL